MAVPETKPSTQRTLVGVVLVILLLLGAYVWRERAMVAETVPVPVAAPLPVPGAVPVVSAGTAAAGVAEVTAGGGAGVVPGGVVAAGGAPTFDVVRVAPDGGVVVAGRAAPGAEVMVWDGGVVIARVEADRQGAFIALPAAPLAVGGQELTLSSRTGAGVEASGSGSVLLNVPERTLGGASGSALLVPKDAAPVVLQGSGGREVAGAAVAKGPTLDRVDYDEAGSIRFAGGAAAGRTVRVYVDNGLVGDAVADPAGRWALMPQGAVAPGVHALRVDQLGADGQVVARVEVPFQRADGPGAVGANQVVVQPGQNLWRLARSAYGQGVRYTVIYLANREQIRDARLIYPGQTFAVPPR